jgi:hypothetical protein
MAAKAQQDPPPLDAKITEGGIQFKLRDDVTMLVVPQSPKEVAVFMSQGDKLVPPTRETSTWQRSGAGWRMRPVRSSARMPRTSPKT